MYACAHTHIYTHIGGEIGGVGGRGARASSFFKYIINYNAFNVLKKNSKLQSEDLRSTLRRLKIPNFPGGACPQTPLNG